MMPRERPAGPERRGGVQRACRRLWRAVERTFTGNLSARAIGLQAGDQLQLSGEDVGPRVEGDVLFGPEAGDVLIEPKA